MVAGCLIAAGCLLLIVLLPFEPVRTGALLLIVLGTLVPLVERRLG